MACAGVVEHAEDQLADAAGILAQQARSSARLELVNPVQRQAHRVFVNLAADRDLNALGRPASSASGSRVPEACPVSRRRSTRATRATSRVLGDSGSAIGLHATSPRRQRMCQDDVVDHGLGRRRRNQLQERRDRGTRERQHDRQAVADQEPVQLAIQSRQRAVLGAAADLERAVCVLAVDPLRCCAMYSRNRSRLAIRRCSDDKDQPRRSVKNPRASSARHPGCYCSGCRCGRIADRIREPGSGNSWNPAS